MKQQQPRKTPAQLASEMVGDGKAPNKFFVTLSFGWMQNGIDEEPKQVRDALQTVTAGPFRSKGAAMHLFNSLTLQTDIDKVKPDTLTSVMVEDRKNGIVIEKNLVKRRVGCGFWIDTREG